VKLSHASKQRREAKHVAWQRQLLVLACWLSLGPGGQAAEPAPSAAPSPPTAQEELRAAKLMEAALFAREAKTEELHKMDGIFAGLEQKYPRNGAIKNAYAEFLWSIDQPQRAMETWLAAEKLVPNDAVVLDHLGGGYLAEGDVRKAMSYYLRAVGSAPEDAAAHFSYANVLFIFRHDLLDSTHTDARAVLIEALGEFSEAARLQPNNADYARAFAETFYSIDSPDWHAALAAWEHFYAVTSQKDFALLNLARVHMKLGQKAEARDRLGQIKDPAYARLKERLSQRLESK
jgi:tetratricopeptide (TPR) repeat protein